MGSIAFLALIAIYVAWNLGANDVANSMGTSVGSKAITLTQAIIIAGILEFFGAVIFGKNVSATIATQVVNSQIFAPRPQLFLVGMIAVSIASGLWLQIATLQGLPVASSHAVVGAIAGFAWVAFGQGAVNWQSIGKICAGWLVTPVLSGVMAIVVFSLLRRSLFQQKSRLALQEWIPWLSSGVVALFGIIVFPELWQNDLLQNLKFNWSLPEHDLSLLLGGFGAIALTIYLWNQLEQLTINEAELTEKIMAKFQVVSACFVAFAHGSNDVGNAIAPLAAILDLRKTGHVPLGNIQIPFWVLCLGGLGIVGGLAVQGKKVISTIGDNIFTLVPSTGFCAEISTAATILLASRIDLPVSTSHALIGSVVGIGLWQNKAALEWQTIRSIVGAWVITIPAAGALSAVIFIGLRHFTI